MELKVGDGRDEETDATAEVVVAVAVVAVVD